MTFQSCATGRRAGSSQYPGDILSEEEVLLESGLMVTFRSETFGNYFSLQEIDIVQVTLLSVLQYIHNIQSIGIFLCYIIFMAFHLSMKCKLPYVE